MTNKKIIDEDLVNSITINPEKKIKKTLEFIFTLCSLILWISFVIDYFFLPKVEEYLNQHPPSSQPNFEEVKWLSYYFKYSEWGPYILILAIILWIFSLTLTFLIKKSKLKPFILIFGLIGFLSHLYLIWITVTTISN